MGKMKMLMDYYPQAILCIDMDHNMWINIDGKRYAQIEVYSITRGMFRILLWDEWYYFTLEKGGL